MNPPRFENSLTGAQIKPSLSGLPERRGEDFSWLDFFLILAQRRKFILAFTVICTIAAAAVSLVLPVEYTATVVILPPQQNSSFGGSLAMQLAGLGSMSGLAESTLGLKNLNEMYVSMLKSRSVEDAVIQKFGLMREYHKKYDVDARKALEKHTEIDGSTKDGLIKLSFENRNAERAAAIANGYVDQFRNLSQHLAITEAAQRRIIFDQQLKKTNDDLANAEQALKETQLSTGMIQVDAQSRAFIEAAAHLRAQVVAKQVQIEAMRSYAANDNPALIEAQRELDGLNAQYNHLVGSQGNSSDDLFLPRGKIPQAGLEYIRKLRDVKYYEAIFEILARQLEIAKLDEAKEGGFIQVVDPAMVPSKKSFPKRMLITAGAAAVALTLAILWVMFQAGLERMAAADPAKREKLILLRQTLGLRRGQSQPNVIRGRKDKREEDQSMRTI
ncbi:MAG TPA: Wzz/FepE/Etk N-terminal domain-containing protein [Terracidiphilus sp.]|nr:Wzz/FepE/Etk N-terminal domain-containing protein [Terracidiphilus sp.]